MTWGLMVTRHGVYYTIDKNKRICVDFTVKFVQTKCNLSLMVTKDNLSGQRLQFGYRIQVNKI